MKRCGKIAICLAGALALNAALRANNAALPGNPYALIVERNVFGLNPPPPPPDLNVKPEEPPVKITANGIMSIFGQWQVLFKTAVASKPGDQSSYMLAEGQAKDDIEVVKIDDKSGFITFNNHGIVEQIQLDKAPATTAVAAPAGSPGFNPVVGRIPLPVLPNGAANNAATGLNPSAPKGSSTGAQIGIGASGAAPTQANNVTQTQTTLDPATQELLILANHLKAEQDGDPSAQIYPVTDQDAEAGVHSNITPPTSPENSPAQ